MCSRSNPCNGLWVTGIILFFVFGSSLIGLIFERNDIWWTPDTMKLSLGDSSDRVMVYLRDEDMRDLIENEQLILRADNEFVTLKQEDIGLRLNNWDRVKASKVWQYAINASMTTLAIVLLILGLVPLFSRRKKESPEELKPLN